MSVGAGTHLGPYEIIALVGEGGMGEVYRARDPRLGRDVAIKVLPAHLSANPETRARFEREARAISQLAHPHICTLYDIGSAPATGSAGSQAAGAAPVDYLVMEYLEGETLAARLEKGPLPLADLTRYGIEIASALARAHRSGIVHRDLKPANVMLTKAGAKLMDFGLARPALLTPGTVAPTDSPTVSRPLTGEGTIVGTLQYMAPEQLEGKEADARTDLWALGCVLYEMASGQRAFAGTSQASLIAAILKEAPRPLPELQPLTPPALERVVKRCLEKDPDERFQSARDLAFDLEGTTATGAAWPSIAGIEPRPRRRFLAKAAVGLVLAAAFVAAGFFLANRLQVSRPTEPRLVRFAVTAAAGVSVVPESVSTAISPDGSRVVFLAADPAGTARLWVRPLDAVAAQPLPGTENALCPFWSPDSRFVAFFAEGKLRKVSVGGGSPEVICDAPDGRGGSWSKDGVIVFAPRAVGPLLRVSANGSEVIEVVRPDAARQETGLRFPCFLPDGRHFLYVSLPRRQQVFDVYVAALDSKEPTRIMSSGSAPIYAQPGYLLFTRGDRLVAQRFDMERLRPVGDILPLGEVAPMSQFEGGSALSASANGVLVHASSPPNTQLVWLDRAGHATGTVPLPPGTYANPTLSPDGRWAAVAKASSPAVYDLWLVDLERAVPTRITLGDYAGFVPFGGVYKAGVWSHDSRRIAFECNPSGPQNLYQVLVSGTGRPELLYQSNVLLKGAAAWTPDGKYLVFSQPDEATGWDLWLLPLTGDRTPVPYLRTPFNENTASVSPDGRWLAYDSDETGTPEIYVQSFPVPGEKHRLSTAGGSLAQWSQNGRELLIWGSSQTFTGVGPILSVEVQTTPTFKTNSAPRVLFTPRQDIAGLTATGDLKRFLAAVPVEGAAPPSIMVMLNWQAALTGR